ncbi:MULTISPECIES: hypothetical protein [unclassified Bradyrhizobium]|nr:MULTISPECIES: hypothetical protein [unclassified Bradyrhizobium]
MSMTSPELTLLFLGIVVSLGAALVWMMWEVEQSTKARRSSSRLR